MLLLLRFKGKSSLCVIFYEIGYYEVEKIAGEWQCWITHSKNAAPATTKLYSQENSGEFFKPEDQFLKKLALHDATLHRKRRKCLEFPNIPRKSLNFRRTFQPFYCASCSIWAKEKEKKKNCHFQTWIGGVHDYNPRSVLFGHSTRISRPFTGSSHITLKGLLHIYVPLSLLKNKQQRWLHIYF